MSANIEETVAFIKDENKANLNFFLTAILKDPGQENEWKKMQFRLPKALADSCLIPELSCQFKPFPWQGFNSFHLSWEFEKVRDREHYPCAHAGLIAFLERHLCLRLWLAIQGWKEPGTLRGMDAAQLLLTLHTTSGSCNPHWAPASARHPRDPAEPPRLTRPCVILSVSHCIQCTSLCNAALSGFHPADSMEVLSLMRQK